jgi:hypothetical protein
MSGFERREPPWLLGQFTHPSRCEYTPFFCYDGLLIFASLRIFWGRKTPMEVRQLLSFLLVYPSCFVFLSLNCMNCIVSIAFRLPRTCQGGQQVQQSASKSFPGSNFVNGSKEGFNTNQGRGEIRANHRPRIPSPPPLCVAKTGRNHLNAEFTPLLPTGIGERF